MVGEYVALGMPGGRGAWCLEDCQSWVDEKIRHRGEARPRAAPAAPPTGDPMLDGPASPQLERFRKIRSDIAEIELEQRRGSVLPTELVHDLLVRLSSVIRGAGEALQRQFGQDAANLLDEALNDVDVEITRFFADHDQPPGA